MRDSHGKGAEGAVRELSDHELDAVSGGSLADYVDGGAAIFGGGAMGYAATLAVGVGLGTVGAAALGVGAVGLVGYGAYRLVAAD